MPFTRNAKIGLTLIIASLVIVAPIVFLSLQNQNPPQDDGDNGDNGDDTYEVPAGSVNVTLLYYAGVMIETSDVRIYIDPYLISSNYSIYPADLILITHAHFDHYSALDIRDVIKNDTLVVCPETMTTQLERYNNSLGVKPGDSFQHMGVNITVYHMYLEDYPYGATSGHPRSSNWTSYIIDIDGFILYHAGDAKYMNEYEDFPVQPDVAFLPIYYDPGYGGKNESLAPIIQTIDMIKPGYCIPTHWYDDDNELFMQDYVPLLEDDCEVMNLEFFSSYLFTDVI